MDKMLCTETELLRLLSLVRSKAFSHVYFVIILFG